MQAGNIVAITKPLNGCFVRRKRDLDVTFGQQLREKGEGRGGLTPFQPPPVSLHPVDGNHGIFMVISHITDADATTLTDAQPPLRRE